MGRRRLVCCRCCGRDTVWRPFRPVSETICQDCIGSNRDAYFDRDGPIERVRRSEDEGEAWWENEIHEGD